MAPKAKLPTEEKVRLVEAYLAEHIDVAALYKTHGIYYKTLSRWVRRYLERGVRGLSPSSSNHKYSHEIKRRAIADYLSGSGSQRDICTRYDISSEIDRLWLEFLFHNELSEKSSDIDFR